MPSIQPAYLKTDEELVRYARLEQLNHDDHSLPGVWVEALLAALERRTSNHHTQQLLPLTQ